MLQLDTVSKSRGIRDPLDSILSKKGGESCLEESILRFPPGFSCRKEQKEDGLGLHGDEVQLQEDVVLDRFY